jgi:hypothetical protein
MYLRGEKRHWVVEDWYPEAKRDERTYCPGDVLCMWKGRRMESHPEI